jgi:hypothetical protein
MAKRQSKIAADAATQVKPARSADAHNPLLAADDYEYHPSTNPAHNALEGIKQKCRSLIAGISDDIRRSIVWERVGNRMFALCLPQLRQFTFDKKNVSAAAKAEALRDFGLFCHGNSEYVNPKNEGETRESRIQAAIKDALDFQLPLVARPKHAKKRKSALDAKAQQEAAEAQQLSETRRLRWNKKNRPQFHGFLDGAHIEFEVPAETEFDADFADTALEAAVDAAHIKLMSDVVRCNELYQDAEEDSDWEAECDNNLFLVEADLIALRDFAKEENIELRDRK